MELDEAIRWLAPGRELEARAAIERSVRKRGGEVQESWLWLAVGDKLYNINAYDKARICYQMAYDVDPDTMSEGRTRALLGIGNSFFMSQDYFAAKEAYLRALDEANGSRFASGSGEALIQLSEVQRALGDLDAATDYAKRALLENERLNRSGGIARAASSLAMLARYREVSGDHRSAEEIIEWSLDRLTRTTQSTDISTARDTLISAQRELKSS